MTRVEQFLCAAAVFDVSHPIPTDEEGAGLFCAAYNNGWLYITGTRYRVTDFGRMQAAALQAEAAR